MKRPRLSRPILTSRRVKIGSTVLGILLLLLLAWPVAGWFGFLDTFTGAPTPGPGYGDVAPESTHP